jgi:hypothetical protein
MTMDLKELVKMFVDESPLTETEIDELLNHYLIERLPSTPPSYQLTTDGRSVLKSV